MDMQIEHDRLLAEQMMYEEQEHREQGSPSDPLLSHYQENGFPGGNDGDPAYRVLMSAREALQETRTQSLVILVLSSILWIVEIVAGTAALVLGWNSTCDVDLKLWVIVMMSRLVFEIPIVVLRALFFRRRSPIFTWANNAQAAVTVLSNFWFMVGLLWVFGSKNCREDNYYLYLYCLVFCFMYVFAVAFPCVLAFALCLCLPCIFLVLRWTGDGASGANQSEINKIPEIIFSSSGPPDGIDDICAICREEYCDNDSIRKLPCGHFFHVSHIDPWLLIKRQCPLCRRDIRLPPITYSGTDTV